MTAGTFSKLLFPSMRLGFVVLPARLVEPFTRAVSIERRRDRKQRRTISIGIGSVSDWCR